MSMSGEVVENGSAGFYRGGRYRVAHVNTQPSMTKQEFRDECDINNIMSKYQRDGLLLHVNKYQGEYADVTGAVDYHTAQNTVLAAQNAFMSVPSELRAVFDNDPGKFLSFVTDPANKEKLYEMGLAVRPSMPILAKEVSDVSGQVSEEVRVAKGSVEKSDVGAGGKSA